MKKTIIAALVVLLLLTACSKTETDSGKADNIDVEEISIFGDNALPSGNVVPDDSAQTGDLFGGEAAKTGDVFSAEE